MIWTLRLPYTRPPLTLNGRQHWARKKDLIRDIRWSVHQLARAAKIPPCHRVHVTLHYVPRATRRRDADNLVATLKPCLDGLVDAGLVADDTPEYVTWTPPVIDPADPNDPHLYLLIEEKT